MEQKKIGMLGAGNMAGALIRGMLASKQLAPEQMGASDPRAERLLELRDELGIRTFADNRELVTWADLVVVAVKPQLIDRVLDQLGDAFGPDTLVVSIAAGVPIRALEARLPSSARVVRAMPNTACIVLAGATAIAPGSRATAADIEITRALFDATGRSVVLDESLLDAVTGLSGSGPAYVMLIIEALADGGVKVGLQRDTALLLAAQTVFGSAKLLLDTGRAPGAAQGHGNESAGTAIAGVHALESGGLRRTLMDAIEVATRRAQEIGEAMAKKLERS